MSEYSLTPGDITTRNEITRVFGGNRQAGIMTTASGNIFVFSDPVRARENGYVHDGWENTDEQVLYYTGQGRVGDQTFARGNRALLEHLQKAHRIYFFESFGPSGAEKRQRFLGEFMVDPNAPYRWDKAPDSDKKMRQVIVFRMLRLSAVSSNLIGATSFEILSDGSRRKAQQPRKTIDLAPPEAIGLEAYYTNEFEVAATAPRTGVRQESAIVDSFNSTLEALGHDLKRFKIPLEEGGAPLLTDTFDLTDSVLWEAKAYSGRGEVRLAIGQIFDYQRYLWKVVPEFSTGIVLPRRPVSSVMDLALEAGHKVAFRNEDTWHIQSPEGKLETLGI